MMRVPASPKCRPWSKLLGPEHGDCASTSSPWSDSRMDCEARWFLRPLVPCPPLAFARQSGSLRKGPKIRQPWWIHTIIWSQNHRGDRNGRPPELPLQEIHLVFSWRCARLDLQSAMVKLSSLCCSGAKPWRLVIRKVANQTSVHWKAWGRGPAKIKKAGSCCGIIEGECGDRALPI